MDRQKPFGGIIIKTLLYLLVFIPAVAYCLDATIPTVTLTTGVASGVQCRESEWPLTTLTVTVTTATATTCKYDTSDIAYASMANTFTTTGSTTHIEQISYSCGSSHNYFVKCADTTNTFNAVFTIDKDPRPRRNITVN